MTLDRMALDGIELSEYLRKHLHRQKIIVVAHSFGTIIALKMVRARPDLYYAYVETGQVADSSATNAIVYKALLAKAQDLNNLQALDELRRVGPPPYRSGQGNQVQEKWANRFQGANQFIFGTLGLALISPGYTAKDLSADIEGQMLSGERLVPQALSITPKDLGLSFEVPIFFFQGTGDLTTPTLLAKRYFNEIRAPHKEFVPIQGGHFAVFTNSSEFLKELVARVLPLTREN